MKLLSSFGPNPRVVRMFMAEKKIDIPAENLDILGAENRKGPYLDKNPIGGLPALELDDGFVFAETAAICEYLEELYPNPPLFGTNPRERAEAHMQLRRIELNVTEHLYNAFRYGPGLELFKTRFRCLPEASEGLLAKAMDNLAIVDKMLDGNKFLCGDRMTMGDITLYCCLDFVTHSWTKIDGKLDNVIAWFKRMESLPSAQSSLTPGWDQVGMRG